MGVTRREFLKGCAAGAAAATLPATGILERAQAAGTPDPVYRPFMEVALDTARQLGATYADMRVCRYHRQQISLRTQGELRTGRVRNVPRIAESESFGFGVRVLAYGAWGFAASSRVDKEDVARVTREAVAVARANAALQRIPIRLAAVQSSQALWRTDFKKEPFAVSVREKLDFLQAVNDETRKASKVFVVSAILRVRSEHKFFTSTEGSYIEQFIQQVAPSYRATAVDRSAGISRVWALLMPGTR